MAFAVALLVFGGSAFARSQQIQEVISGRSGKAMTVQTPDSEKVTVMLSQNTEVVEPEGLFRKKHFAITALIPAGQGEGFPQTRTTNRWRTRWCSAAPVCKQLRIFKREWLPRKSGQVAPDNTVEGQAENRRVVVKILQNKGIAGT